MLTIDYGSVSFQYAAQILGVASSEQLPVDLRDKIYWTLRGIHIVRAKELSLEQVAVLCQPYLQEKIQKATQKSLEESKVAKQKAVKSAKARQAKSKQVFESKAAQLKLDNQDT